MEDVTAGSVTFNRLIQGFMGLGLLVGVAALGVISARSVVERRQQIGVMRAIGFRRRMVEASFLLESSFLALTSIVVGTVLGLILAWNIIADQRREPSWAGLTLARPLGQPARHLRARLRGRDRRHDRAGAPRRARAAGRGAALRVSGLRETRRRTAVAPQRRLGARPDGSRAPARSCDQPPRKETER